MSKYFQISINGSPVQRTLFFLLYPRLQTLLAKNVAALQDDNLLIGAVFIEADWAVLSQFLLRISLFVAIFPNILFIQFILLFQLFLNSALNSATYFQKLPISALPQQIVPMLTNMNKLPIFSDEQNHKNAPITNPFI